MSRVSFDDQKSEGTTEVPSGRKRKYVASRDYGTRSYEHQKLAIRFGTIKATIYRRSDVANGSWYLRFHLRQEGRPYRQSLGTTDGREAREQAEKVIIDVLTRARNGERILAVPLRELLRRFTLYQEYLVKSDQISPNTYRNQHSRVKLGCEFLKTAYSSGLDTRLSGIDGSVFDGYLRWRQEQVAKKREGGTIRRDVVRDELIVIRKMFSYGKKEGLCTERSVPKWDFAVEKEGSKRQRITPRNFKDFLNTAVSWGRESSEPRDRYNRLLYINIAALVSSSGMRSGEVFKLKNRFVERRGNNDYLIRIQPKTSKHKTGREIRVIAPGLSLWLAKHQRHRSPDDFLFSPYDSGTVWARNVFYHQSKQLRKRLEDIDLGWFDLYHCRHWWITNQLLAEHSPALVAQAAGTSIKEIESTYSHVLTEMTTKKFNKTKVVFTADNDWKVLERLEEN